jgi:formamidopyrimidine-DNA glycosylase
MLGDAFGAALGGRPATTVRIVDPLVLRTTPDEASALVGQVLRDVGRRGKHLVFRFERHDMWAAPMLTGRFGLIAPGVAKPRPAVAIGFGPSMTPAGPPADWVAGAPWLPDPRDEVELRYLDPTRMGKIYLAPSADPTRVPGIAELGPDADDEALTLDEWQARIRRHPGELKALLRNQAFVAGIGNAYSDEILWEARLSPFRRRATLAPEETAALYVATRSVLAAAIGVLRVRVPPTFEKQVRDHVRVHLRGGQPCGRCGTTISQIGGREATSYCRACQR